MSFIWQLNQVTHHVKQSEKKRPISQTGLYTDTFPFPGSKIQTSSQNSWPHAIFVKWYSISPWLYLLYSLYCESLNGLKPFSPVLSLQTLVKKSPAFLSAHLSTRREQGRKVLTEKVWWLCWLLSPFLVWVWFIFTSWSVKLRSKYCRRSQNS